MNSTFTSEESGAVTVDWVVLTAALVGLGLAVTGVVSGGVGALTTQISGSITSTPITTSFGGGEIAAVRDWSTYEPLSQGVLPANWGDENGLDTEGRTWAQNTYDGWSQWSNETLIAEHDTYHFIASNGLTNDENTRQKADYLAITSQIMADRNLTPAEGQMSYDEVRARFGS
jgi:hypothetical protein